jgi:hypothetical protein
LLASAEARQRQSNAARELVELQFSWERVACQFEAILFEAAAARTQ